MSYATYDDDELEDLRRRKAEQLIELDEGRAMTSVYFVQAGTDGPIKIGIARNVKTRIDTLQIGNHERLTVLHASKGDQADEARLHRLLRAHRIRGEWFHPHPDVLRAMQDFAKPETRAEIALDRADYFSDLSRCMKCETPDLKRGDAYCAACAEVMQMIQQGIDPAAA